MSIQRILRSPRTWFVAGLVFLVVAGGLWCYKTSRDPERAFWGTVQQSLTTNAVSVTSNQANSQTIAHQVTKYSFGAHNMSQSITTLTQGNTVVKNESVGTQNGDYTRYLSIDTDQKTPAGKPMHFDKVIGAWAKADKAAKPQLFAQASLGTGLPLGGLAIPIANLDPERRDLFVQKMRDDRLYKIDFNKVKKATKDGRLQYTYDAKIAPVAYATMMKQVAKEIGLHDLDQLDPASLGNQEDFSVSLTIDVYAHRLVGVQTGNGLIQQTYSGYDVPVSIVLPAQTISFDELQKRLNAAQQ